MSAEAFEQQIGKALALTNKPVGVNIPLSRSHERVKGFIDVALRHDVVALFLGGGNPAPWADVIKAAGKRLVIVVGGPRQARKAESLGADAVVAEGLDAGGLIASDEIGTLSLIPAVADSVRIPVVAAGGIADARGAAAAICLGAAAVQMGTRFMIAEESPLDPRTKQALIDADVTDTVIVARRQRVTRRMLRNEAATSARQIEETASLEDMMKVVTPERSHKGLLEGDTRDGMVSCGQGLGQLAAVEPAAVIVRSIMDGLALVAEDLTGQIARLPTGANG
jgi:enoyl-[acyl-carrier protein] reductase II